MFHSTVLAALTALPCCRYWPALPTPSSRWQVATAGQLSPRADVWSFGLILIELYYGATLGEAQEISDLLRPPGPRRGPQQPLLVHAPLLEVRGRRGEGGGRYKTDGEQ